jgi:hypothetical protein
MECLDYVATVLVGNFLDDFFVRIFPCVQLGLQMRECGKCLSPSSRAGMARQIIDNGFQRKRYVYQSLHLQISKIDILHVEARRVTSATSPHFFEFRRA